MGFLFQKRGALRLDHRRRECRVSAAASHRLARHRDSRAARARLADVGLERDYDKMPSDLSGGMRKRAGLARAMALDPDILLVDEPSAGLDPITSDEIDDLLLDAEAGGHHDRRGDAQHPERTSSGDELAMLHEGRIIAQVPQQTRSERHPLVRASCDRKEPGSDGRRGIGR